MSEDSHFVGQSFTPDSQAMLTRHEDHGDEAMNPNLS